MKHMSIVACVLVGSLTLCGCSGAVQESARPVTATAQPAEVVVTPMAEQEESAIAIIATKVVGTPVSFQNVLKATPQATGVAKPKANATLDKISKPSGSPFGDKNMVDKSIMEKPVNRVPSDTYNDPGLYLQYALHTIDAQMAWAEVEQKETITIAVIDTGVDYTHEDLANRVDVTNGYDFVNDDTDPMDDNGHGTHVAGIIAAEANNDLGIAGIVGELNVEILPLKALNAQGEGTAQDIIDAIDYAVAQGVDIINLSLGTESRSNALDSAVERAIAKGVFVVAAAGNDGSKTGFASPVGVDGVIAVGATTKTNQVADFSNYGRNIDIGAPGEGIVSTYLNNQYALQDGTSMATPIISGAVAILLAENPDLTIAEMTSLLCDNTTALSKGGVNTNLWFGIVNIYDALCDVNSL